MSLQDTTSKQSIPSNLSSAISGLQADAVSGSLHRLENKECIQKYSAPLNTEYSSLVVVTKSHSIDNNSVLEYFLVGPFLDTNFVSAGHSDPSWTCDGPDKSPFGPCSSDQPLEDAATWNFTYYSHINAQNMSQTSSSKFEEVVDYCLAQPFHSTSFAELDQGTL